MKRRVGADSEPVGVTASFEVSVAEGLPRLAKSDPERAVQQSGKLWRDTTNPDLKLSAVHMALYALDKLLAADPQVAVVAARDLWETTSSPAVAASAIFDEHVRNARNPKTGVGYDRWLGCLATNPDMPAIAEIMVARALPQLTGWYVTSNALWLKRHARRPDLVEVADTMLARSVRMSAAQPSSPRRSRPTLATTLPAVA